MSCSTNGSPRWIARSDGMTAGALGQNQRGSSRKGAPLATKDQGIRRSPDRASCGWPVSRRALEADIRGKPNVKREEENPCANRRDARSRLPLWRLRQLAVVPKLALWRHRVCVKAPEWLSTRKRSNSPGESGVSAGIMADGKAPDGTGAALIGDAVWAGVVRTDGTGGDIIQ